MTKVTMKDIAQRLGVTIGTVSHALNNMNDISDEMKKKVYATAEQMGYIANGTAISLRSGRTSTIAVIVPDISNPHLGNQVKMIEDNIRQRNYSVLILNTDEDDALEHTAIITACQKQVDGIMLCPSQHSDRNVKFLQKSNIPFVLVGRYFRNTATDYVCSDDRKGGFLAANYLLDRGYKDIVYIGVSEYIEASANRFAGIIDAHEARHLPFDSDRKILTKPQSGNAKTAVNELCRRQTPFDSIIAFSDLLAFETMHAIKSVYKTEKIPVIGFDGIHAHLSLPFPYASVKMTEHGWADKCVEILFDKIENNTAGYAQALIDVAMCEYNIS